MDTTNFSNPEFNVSSDFVELEIKKVFVQNWLQILNRNFNDRIYVEIIFKEFIELVEVNFCENHSPLFYANELNITKSYLRKICRSTMLVSPSNCIYFRLMYEAFFLLENPRLTIKEIAFTLGFTSPNYFSRFFKKHSGVSPGIYRKAFFKSF